ARASRRDPRARRARGWPDPRRRGAPLGARWARRRRPADGAVDSKRGSALGPSLSTAEPGTRTSPFETPPPRSPTAGQVRRAGRFMLREETPMTYEKRRREERKRERRERKEADRRTADEKARDREA